MAIEEPKFEVVRTFADFEVRRYEPRIVAETRVEGSMDQSGSEGFRRLAGYIFGGNRPRAASTEQEGQKISMTAPVGSERRGSDGWLMSFTMPRDWTLTTLPVPNDSRVQVVSLPEQWLAVLKFSGTWSEERFAEKAQALREAITREKIQLKDLVPKYARYNPPMMPWFLRRNEVWFEVQPFSPN